MIDGPCCFEYKNYHDEWGHRNPPLYTVEVVVSISVLLLKKPHGDLKLNEPKNRCYFFIIKAVLLILSIEV